MTKYQCNECDMFLEHYVVGSVSSCWFTIILLLMEIKWRSPSARSVMARLSHRNAVARIWMRVHRA